MNSRLRSVRRFAAPLFAGLLCAGALLGCSGGGDTTQPPVDPPPTTAIAITAGTSLATTAGQSAATDIVITRQGGYAGNVALAIAGLPSGVTATFDPATLSGNATTSRLTFTVSAATVTGSYPVTVTAAGTGVAAVSTQFTVTINTTPQPQPQLLTSLGLGAVNERFTAELWVRGTTAYTSTWGTRGLNRGNAVKIWDISANTPQLVDSILVANAGTLGDVQVSDDGTLLVVGIEPTPNGGLGVYRLNTPRNATLLARTVGGELALGVHTVEVARVNGVLYAFCSVDPGNGVPARLVIVSLENPAVPTTVASILMGAPFVHDVFVRDGLLFTGEWNDGVGIWDIGGGGTGGTVAVPKRIARLATEGGEVHNMWWYHDPVSGSKRYLFVGEEGPGVIGSSSSGDVHVVDVSTLSAPVEVARYRVPGAGAHNFSMDEANGLLYVAFYNGGVRALDVRGDLGSCTAPQRTSDGRCDLALMGREFAAFTGAGVYVWGVHWSSSGLFASDMLSGLRRLAPAVR